MVPLQKLAAVACLFAPLAPSGNAFHSSPFVHSSRCAVRRRPALPEYGGIGESAGGAGDYRRDFESKETTRQMQRLQEDLDRASEEKLRRLTRVVGGGGSGDGKGGRLPGMPGPAAPARGRGDGYTWEARDPATFLVRVPLPAGTAASAVRLHLSADRLRLSLGAGAGKRTETWADKGAGCSGDVGVAKEEVLLEGALGGRCRPGDSFWVIEGADSDGGCECGSESAVVGRVEPAEAAAAGPRMGPVLVLDLVKADPDAAWQGLLAQERDAQRATVLRALTRTRTGARGVRFGLKVVRAHLLFACASSSGCFARVRASFIFPQVTDRCFLDLAANGSPLGRVEVGLFGEVCPRTVANFKALCAGVDLAPGLSRGAAEHSAAPRQSGGAGPTRRLHLKGSRFHRIIPVPANESLSIFNSIPYYRNYVPFSRILLSPFFA